MEHVKHKLCSLARGLTDVPLVVTGGSGFLGRSIVEILEETGIRNGFVLDNRPIPDSVARHSRPLQNIGFIQADLTDPAELQRILPKLPPKFALVHMASKVSTHAEIDAEGITAVDVEVGMASNLLSLFGERLAHLCFVSSVEVFGKLQILPADELHAVAPCTTYGLAKLAAEHLFKVAAKSHVR